MSSVVTAFLWFLIRKKSNKKQRYSCFFSTEKLILLSHVPVLSCFPLSAIGDNEI